MHPDSDMAEVNKDLKIAAELLKKDGFSFVAVNGENIITSRKRGIAPLLELLEEGSTLEGYCVADKVIGMAAAYLYVILKPDEIYALTVSEHALSVFENYGFSVSYENKVSAIRNRTNTGFCPMEQAVIDAVSPDEALTLIKKRLRELNQK